MHQRRLSLSHLTGTSRFVRGLNLWSPRRSSSAASSAVTASDDEVHKSSRKKITKAERKSLLVSFVNNYRAMNSGKFPSANMVQKEIGGGYYAVRKAIQVMEFETQMSCTRLEVEKTVEKSKAPEAQVLFGSQEIFGAEVPVNNSSCVTALKDKQVAREIILSTEKDPVSSSLMNDDGIKILLNTSDSKDVQDPVLSSLMNDEDIKILPHTLDSKDVQDPVLSSLLNDEDIKILPHTLDSKDVQDPVLSSLVNDEDFKILPHTLDSKDVQYCVSSSVMNDEDIKILPNTLDSKDVQYPVTSSLMNDEDIKILPHTSDPKDAPDPVLSSLMDDEDIKILPHTLDSRDASDPVLSSLMDDEDIKILPHTLDSKDAPDPVLSNLMDDEDIKILPHTLDFNVPSVDVGENPSKCDSLVLEQNDYPGKSVVSSATDDKADVITQKTGMSNEESKHMATTPETSDLKKEKTITVDGRQHESSKIDDADAVRDTSREHDDNVELPKKAFEWNLKSVQMALSIFGKSCKLW